MARVRSRPRSRVGASARQGPSRPSVGRRRRRSSPLGSAGGLLFRLETAGITLLVLALIAVPWLIPATRGVTDLRDGFVRTFGLLVFAFIALIALLGLALIRRRLDNVFATWKPWAIVALSATFVSGLLGFSVPAGSWATCCWTRLPPAATWDI